MIMSVVNGFKHWLLRDLSLRPLYSPLNIYNIFECSENVCPAAF